MTTEELTALKEEVALLKARLATQQEMLETEARQRIAVEEALARALKERLASQD